MTDVYLKYVNSIHVRVIAEPGIVMELSEHLTFFAENYKWNPKFKARIWDGRIRLLNSLTGLVYAGLAQRIKKFCDARGYSFGFDDELCYENISEHELREFIASLNIPDKFEIRDYQFDSILKCIRSNRRTLVSPTSSGKSLMIYILMRWYGRKGLVIVPTIGLVGQMEGDFREYGFTGTIHTSVGGLSKSDDIDADMVVTTWQSLNNGKTKMPKSWYQQFTSVFGDEAHGAKALCLVQILSCMDICKYRFGTTGTLDGVALNEATIEGLFGPKYQATTTKELIDAGYASKLKIKCIVLKYPDEVKKGFVKTKYPDEINYIVNYGPRNQFIKNLVLSLKGNKLVFFKKLDHGKILYDILKPEVEHLFYIDGSVSGDIRNDFRGIIEEKDEAVLLASLGTTSTGVSIRKLHHMIGTAPFKSKTKVPQSIGRMLRLHDSKDEKGAILYDIVDDISWKGHKNFALKHFEERVKMYEADRFYYEIYYLKLK